MRARQIWCAGFFVYLRGRCAMILGLSIQTFTIIHVVISLMAIRKRYSGVDRHVQLAPAAGMEPHFFCSRRYSPA
jgi:hypothetical protein